MASKTPAEKIKDLRDSGYSGWVDHRTGEKVESKPNGWPKDS